MKKLLILSSLLSISTLIEAQDLQFYIQEAEANNPDIQAYEIRHTIAKEKTNETDWLPSTEIRAGYFVGRPETRTGAQVSQLSVRQLLPWFGTLSAREQATSAIAETEFLEISIAKRKLRLSVTRSYYALYAIEAKKKVIKSQITLLKTYEKLALSSLEVGKASAVDVLRLQIRQNDLQKQNEILQQELLTEQTTFNYLLNRSEAVPVNTIKQLVLPSKDPIHLEDSIQLNPELVKYDRLYESVTQAELLNRKESRPMLGFGLDYVNVKKRPNMAFDGNGKDIIMPMASLSIPIFDKRYKSVSKQNELRQKEILLKKKNRTNFLSSLLTQVRNSLKIARIQYENHEKNIVQAFNAEEILLKNYETGNIDFKEVLDIQELQLQIQVSRIVSVQQYFEQNALMAYLTQI